MAFKMKNKAVMKMAKMAGDSRTAMKMKNEAAMKMKKQSAMKMKDPMDMKKDPMKMKKDPMKMKKEPMKMKKEPMKMKKEPMKMKKGSAMDMKKEPMKMKKGSAMKKKTDDDDKFMTEEQLDTFYKNQPEKTETTTYPKNHPLSVAMRKNKKLYNDGKISFEALEQLNAAALDKYKGGGKTEVK